MNTVVPSGPGSRGRNELETAQRTRGDTGTGLARRGGRGVTADTGAPQAALARRLEDLPRQAVMPRGSYVDILA
ncbi:MAG: hypothetical protein ACO3DJ_01720 [Alphaproteobacteria bacterium]|jgi:hypothetical protein